MGCIDAIGIGDSREVFVLSPTFEFISNWDGYCLTMGGDPTDTKAAMLRGCNASMSQKYEVDRTGAIRSLNGRNFCLVSD